MLNYQRVATSGPELFGFWHLRLGSLHSTCRGFLGPGELCKPAFGEDSTEISGAGRTSWKLKTSYVHCTLVPLVVGASFEFDSLGHLRMILDDLDGFSLWLCHILKTVHV